MSMCTACGWNGSSIANPGKLGRGGVWLLLLVLRRWRAFVSFDPSEMVISFVASRWDMPSEPLELNDSHAHRCELLVRDVC
jgi:hypothetical protein